MLEQSAHLHERGTAQALRRLKKVEALKLLFRKLQYARTLNQRQGVTSIEIPLHPTDNPKACTEWQQKDIPSEVLQYIQTRNREHFRQARGTPFTVPPLSEHFGFTGYSEYGQQMLDGKYNSADLESNVQLLIQHLEHIHEMELDESRPTVTAEEFRGKLKIWSESTSTSPSGMHLGQYKALIAKRSFSSSLPDDELPPEYCLQRDKFNSKQADLFELHLALINYALERGTTYKRWQKNANSIRRLVFVTVTKLGQCNQKWLSFRNCNQIWLLFVLCLHILYLVTINIFNNHFCSFINVYGEILIILC